MKWENQRGEISEENNNENGSYEEDIKVTNNMYLKEGEIMKWRRRKARRKEENEMKKSEMYLMKM